MVKELTLKAGTAVKAWTPEEGDAALYGASALFAVLTIALSGLVLYRQWAMLAVGPYVAAAVVSALIGHRRRHLESLEPPVPHVIFTTAYDEFAVKAFELNAIDYLLKPGDPARLAAAVERLPGLRQAEAPRRPAAGILDASDKVFVREGEKCWFVEVGQIRLLESEGNYTRVHFGDAQPQLFRSLNAMEERLDPKFFFRANRRQIVNISWIAGIEPWFSSGLLVQLKGGAKVELSRRQAQEFRERMSL